MGPFVQRKTVSYKEITASNFAWYLKSFFKPLLIKVCYNSEESIGKDRQN